MNITKEQLQQIRDALAYYGHSSVARPETTEALRVLDAALAAPEQEPVAWVEVTHSTHENYKFHGIEYLPIGKHNLYTAPVPAPQRETNVVEALRRCLDELKGHNDSPYCDFRDSFNDIMEQAESALGAKNVDRAPHAPDAVAWMPDTGYVFADAKNANAAPQREWVGLTDEQENQFVKQLIDCGVGLVVPLYKIIEKIDTALKEKNT